MALDNLIAGSYGSEDCVFGGHDFDRERARKALIAADQEGVGFAEFLERHRQYLAGRGCSEEHIIEQLEGVKNLDNYFSLD